MKIYENGQAWSSNKHIGMHTEDISDLLTLKDERGRYALFIDTHPPRSLVLFEDILKAKMLLRKLGFTVSGNISESYIQMRANTLLGRPLEQTEVCKIESSCLSLKKLCSCEQLHNQLTEFLRDL